MSSVSTRWLARWRESTRRARSLETVFDRLFASDDVWALKWWRHCGDNSRMLLSDSRTFGLTFEVDEWPRCDPDITLNGIIFNCPCGLIKLYCGQVRLSAKRRTLRKWGARNRSSWSKRWTDIVAGWWLGSRDYNLWRSYPGELHRGGYGHYMAHCHPEEMLLLVVTAGHVGRSYHSTAHVVAGERPRAVSTPKSLLTTALCEALCTVSSLDYQPLFIACLWHKSCCFFVAVPPSASYPAVISSSSQRSAACHNAWLRASCAFIRGLVFRPNLARREWTLDNLGKSGSKSLQAIEEKGFVSSFQPGIFALSESACLFK